MRFHIVEDRKYNCTQRRLQLVLSNKQHQLSFYGGGTDFFIILNKNLLGFILFRSFIIGLEEVD